MLRSTRQYSRLLAVAGAVGAIGVLVQQSALSQLGLTEAAARDLVVAEVRAGNELGPSGAYSQLVTAGRKAYQKVPAAARGAVTTALFAWAKSYANTPAFKAAYGTIRSEMQPQHRQYALTVEQEVQKNIQEQLASVEAIKKTAPSMPAKDRAQMLELAKQTEANLRNPAIVNADRAEREAARAKDRAEIEAATREWQARYPAEVRGYVALTLRQFLDATAGVDFSAKVVMIQGEGGESLGFADPANRTKPWQWVECILVGPDAVAAARAAGESWLKELGTP